MKYDIKGWAKIAPKSRGLGKHRVLDFLACKPLLYAEPGPTTHEKAEHQQTTSTNRCQEGVDCARCETTPRVLLAILLYYLTEDFGVLRCQLSAGTFCGPRIRFSDAHDPVSTGKNLSPRAAVFRTDRFDCDARSRTQGNDASLNGFRSFVCSKASNWRVDRENRSTIDFDRCADNFDGDSIRTCRRVVSSIAGDFRVAER